MPSEIRTTAPASLTSISGTADAVRRTVAAGMASLTIGTKLGVAGVVGSLGTLGTSWRIARRQHLLRTDLPPPRNLGHSCPWNQRLRDDPGLLIR